MSASARSLVAVLSAILTLGAFASTPSHAGIMVTPTAPLSDPLGNLGARIRWGATGWEASIRRGAYTIGSTNFAESFPANLNPAGTPAWVANQEYGFRITWTGSTGTVGLNVDFNQDGDFEDAQESTSFVFSHRMNFGYRGIQIFGNEIDSDRRSTITGLTINGDSQSDLTPSGSSLDTFYKDSLDGLLENISIDGKFKITNIGTGALGTNDERPQWTFGFRSPAASVVPEPGLASALLLGLAGLGCGRRRRR